MFTLITEGMLHVIACDLTLDAGRHVTAYLPLLSFI